MIRHSLALSAVLWIAVTPAPVAAQDRFFDSNGVRIRYIEQGRGTPVILLHGIGGTLQTWVDAGVLENLAADHRVIAFDARGHGLSGKPHDPSLYAKEMALDVVRLLDHLSIPKAHIVGYSMGAGTTSQLLTLRPDRFLTAVLGAGAGRLGLHWSDADEQAAQQEASEREKDCISRTLAYRLAPTNGPKPTEAQLKTNSEACFADPTQDRFAVAALTRARRHNMIPRDLAAAVRVPTVGVVGTLDPALAALQDLKKLRPELKLVTIDGAVHSSRDPRGAMRSPKFVSAIREFISADH